MSLGKKFLSAVIAEGSVAALLQKGPVDHLFKASEIDAYTFVRSFVKQYQALPTLETVENHTGDALVKHDEPSSYYFDLLELRHIEHSLKHGMKVASDLLLPENKDPEEALKALTETAMSLVARKHAKQVIDFRDAYDLVWGGYVSKQKATDTAGLQFGWPTLDEMSGGMARGDMISFVGRPQQGKATAVSTPILLADGSFKRMGAIQLGDAVASIDGAPSTVIGVFPQGVRAVYRVTLSDGRTLDVDKEHLWSVGSKRWSTYRVLTTLDIMQVKGRLFLPPFAGEFGSTAPFMDPYLLGALLGDGCLCASDVRFTSMDPEVVDRVKQGLPPGHGLIDIRRQNSGQATEYRVVTLASEAHEKPRNHVKACLRSVGLYGCSSAHKFLPQKVFQWSRQDRLALLQGLMDTDGTAGLNQAVFGASSERLVRGVARLVWSLGGKVGWFAPKKTTHLDHYRLSVILPNAPETFSLTRHSERMSPKDVRVYIDSVEEFSFEECQCINVSHPSKLFLAGDYIVTHNTWQMLYGARYGWNKAGMSVDPDHGQSRMFVSMEMAVLPISERLAAMQVPVQASHLKHGMSTKEMKKLKDGLTMIKGYAAPFYVVDGNLAATVEDIWALARQLKPDAIFIDGAYLVKHPKERDRYRRVAENAELMKSELAALAPTVCSWQFAKSAAKKNKKQGEKPDLEDIGYTDAIAQVSSLVLGLFEDDSNETLAQRRVEILKGRSGETGSFTTRWDFVNMRFDEIVPESVDTMQFG